MVKHEQKFCTALTKWLCYNWKTNCAIEAKIAVGTAPFNLNSGFKPHQLQMLVNIKGGPFGYKISDMDRMQKPFDIIYSHKSPAFVALHWVRPGNKIFYLIDPTTIMGLIDDSHKSITEKTAGLIAYKVGYLA